VTFDQIARKSSLAPPCYVAAQALGCAALLYYFGTPELIRDPGQMTPFRQKFRSTWMSAQ
jgi:hypothetical protein